MLVELLKNCFSGRLVGYDLRARCDYASTATGARE